MRMELIDKLEFGLGLYMSSSRSSLVPFLFPVHAHVDDIAKLTFT